MFLRSSLGRCTAPPAALRLPKLPACSARWGCSCHKARPRSCLLSGGWEQDDVRATSTVSLWSRSSQAASGRALWPRGAVSSWQARSPHREGGCPVPCWLPKRVALAGASFTHHLWPCSLAPVGQEPLPVPSLSAPWSWTLQAPWPRAGGSDRLLVAGHLPSLSLSGEAPKFPPLFGAGGLGEDKQPLHAGRVPETRKTALFPLSPGAS